MDIKELRELHHKAMDLAAVAFLKRSSGNHDEAIKISKEAFELEKRCALMLLDEKTLEPSRSILFRSAATLAFDCGKYDEAEKLAKDGLNGNPPQEIAEELNTILAVINKKKPQ